MEIKKVKISLILNITNVVFVLFAFFSMVYSFNFMSNNLALSTPSYRCLKYFTIDSNLLVGLFSIPLIYEEILILKNKKEDYSKLSLSLKLVGTVGVALTFLTVVFFLAPTFDNGFVVMFANSNLFMHLVNPLIAIVSFIFFEKSEKLNIVDSLYGMIPMFIYGVYYTVVTLVHTNTDGTIQAHYDWYGFLQGNIYKAFIVIPIMLGGTYLISYLLYRFNKNKVN